MLTKTDAPLDFLVMSDDMYLLDQIALQNHWTDVKEFCQGEMVTSPTFSKGWYLIPADQYEYRIPQEAVQRVHKLVESGVHLQGIVIADDARSRSGKSDRLFQIPSQINWKLVWRVLRILGMIVAGIVAVVAFFAFAIAVVTVGLGVLAVAALGGALMFDPKLLVLISDGEGNTRWICLYTWYEPPSR